MKRSAARPDGPGYASAAEVLSALTALGAPPPRRRVWRRVWRRSRASAGAWLAALLLLFGAFSCRDGGRRFPAERVVTAGTLGRY